MKRVHIETTDRFVDCKTHTPVGDGLLSSGLRIPMMCGGKGLCATCQVVVTEGMENLSPIQGKEEAALNRLAGRSPGSRLSCQAKVLGDVSVKMPDADYVTQVEEIDLLIGTRAPKDILHSSDGRLLVRAGQLVTKYVVTQARKSITQ